MVDNRIPEPAAAGRQREDELLSIISHELRTPLSSILGYSDILLRGLYGPLNDRQSRAQQAIRNNAQRLLQMINDLLDVSKLDAGAIQAAPQPLALRPAITGAVEVVQAPAAAAQVRLVNQVAPDLPMVSADEARLRQILLNLLSNAIKFTPPGGQVCLDARPCRLPPGAPPARREEAAAAPGATGAQSIEVTVQDTGIGLTAEHLAYIWQRFYQVDSTSSRRYGGAGLGLYIVQRLVELHGGVAWAGSAGPGQGTTIHFRLPLADPGPEIHP